MIKKLAPRAKLVDFSPPVTTGVKAVMNMTSKDATAGVLDLNDMRLCVGQDNACYWPGVH